MRAGPTDSTGRRVVLSRTAEIIDGLVDLLQRGFDRSADEDRQMLDEGFGSVTGSRSRA
jgi:hypothetical protein